MSPGQKTNILAHRQGLTDQVYDAIVDLMLDGLIEEDSPIRIENLAEMLGVSATPVREALVRMESTGLVRRVNFKGYRAASRLTQKELQDLMEVRKLLEPQAAYLACTHDPDAVLEKLTVVLDEQRQSYQAGDVDSFKKFMRADQRFHRIIHEASNNSFLESAANALGGNVQRWRQFENRVVVDAEESLAEHEDIVQAFETKDPDTVYAAMLKHLENLSQRVSQGAVGTTDEK